MFDYGSSNSIQDTSVSVPQCIPCLHLQDILLEVCPVGSHRPKKCASLGPFPLSWYAFDPKPEICTGKWQAFSKSVQENHFWNSTGWEKIATCLEETWCISHSYHAEASDFLVVTWGSSGLTRHTSTRWFGIKYWNECDVCWQKFWHAPVHRCLTKPDKDWTEMTKIFQSLKLCCKGSFWQNNMTNPSKGHNQHFIQNNNTIKHRTTKGSILKIRHIWGWILENRHMGVVVPQFVAIGPLT